MEGKLDNNVRENIMNHLGSLLYKRELTMAAYQRTVDEISKSLFIASDNSLEDFKELSSLSIALHKEAAALDVLAQSFRVRQG